METISISEEIKPDVGKNHGTGGNVMALVDVVVGSCMNKPCVSSMA